MTDRLRALVCMVLAAFVIPASAVDFVHEVMPILKEHCSECHTGKKKKGGLAMNTRAQLLAGGENGKVVIPGDAAKSLFMELIHSTDDDEYMPPKGPRMPAEQVAILTKWINAGVPWEPGIQLGKSAWEPPLKPRVIQLPPARKGRAHPVDRLLDAGLAKDKLSTPSKIDDAAFLRRAHLDIHGLLPTPAALDAFVADSATDKREKLIDSLLAQDVAYADHWLTTWNDLLRNDYTGTGFITGGRKQITTWLYKSLRDNKPYDQLVRELISPTKESAGFIDGIKWRGDVNSSQTREIQFSQNVSQVFLGINMKCASCHDSFIDRWKLSEAYNLAAIYSDEPMELNRCDKPIGKMATPKWIFPEIGDVDPKAPKAKRLEQLAALMTHPENGRFSRTVVNRLWARLMGRGIVHPVDAMDSQPWNEDLLDFLGVQFAKDGYDLRKFIRFVMMSQAYQSQSEILKGEPGEDYVYAGPIAKRMTAEQLLDSIWQITGTNPGKAAANVDRRLKATEAAVANGKKVEPSLAAVPIAAQWIWSEGPVVKKIALHRKFSIDAVPSNAIVVATCDNEFTMKINGKKVLHSADWQAANRIEVASHLVKGENLIEVSAEMHGGSAGFVCQLGVIASGKQIVIPSDKSWLYRQADGQWVAAKEVAAHGAAPWSAVLGKTMGDAKGTSGPAPAVRAGLVKNDFLMRSLGRPHRDQVVTSRPGELTTLQAIDLSNGDILAGYLAAGGKKLAAKGRSGSELIDWLFRYALSREPTAGERRVLVDVAGDGRNPVAVEDVLWPVFMLPEFQIIR